MNTSGINPTGFRVLIKPEDVEDEVYSEGGILIETGAEESNKRAWRQSANQRGTLVAVGPTAWRDFDKNYKSGSSWYKWAEVGNKVMFTKFGGKFVQGIDGEEYILLNDEDITAVITGEVK